MTDASTMTVQPTDAPLIPAGTSLRRAARFARHYLEMAVAMVVGMLVLDPPLKLGLELLGTRPGTWRDGAPELSVLTMGVTIAIAMAAWMSVRRHRWQATLVMCTAMLAPTAAAAVVLAAGVTDNGAAVFAAEHTAMFVAMFAVMVWRRGEYGYGDPGTPAVRLDVRTRHRPHDLARQLADLMPTNKEGRS